MEFFSPQYSGEPFRLFGTVHIWTLVVFALVNIIFFTVLKKANSPKLNKIFRVGFAIFLFASNILGVIWDMQSPNWSFRDSLPLHLCNIAVILSVIILVFPRQGFFEVLYFWGFSGTFQAIITPDMTGFNFPHFMYFKFYVLHCGIVTTILYFTIIEKYKPTWVSVLKVFVITNIYAGFVGVINYILNTNYMYLCEKPAGSSIISFLGQWPWYLVSLEFIAILLYIICYLPYYIKSKIHHSSNSPLTPLYSREGDNIKSSASSPL